MLFMKRSRAIFCAIVAVVGTVSAQTTRPPQPSAGVVSGAAPPSAADDQTSTLASARQTAQIFGIDRKIQRVRELQAERGANTSLTEEERSLRLGLLESLQMAILDIDGVLGEISNERNQLGDLRASLQLRRDKSVGRFTTAALLTGSGVGIAINATQYSSFSSRTNNVSIMAAKRQKGPNGSVGDVPNMLAPLLGGAPVLNTYYPPAVLQYLQSVPPDDLTHGTRLDQLKQSWIKSGRLDSSSAKTEQQTTAIATSSQNPDVKVSIDDLTNRMAMLGDVEGRVYLMKRDLSVLMRLYIKEFRE
jgi:hypothetical protein